MSLSNAKLNLIIFKSNIVVQLLIEQFLIFSFLIERFLRNSYIKDFYNFFFALQRRLINNYILDSVLLLFKRLICNILYSFLKLKCSQISKLKFLQIFRLKSSKLFLKCDNIYCVFLRKTLIN